MKDKKEISLEEKLRKLIGDKKKQEEKKVEEKKEEKQPAEEILEEEFFEEELRPSFFQTRREVSGLFSSPQVQGAPLEENLPEIPKDRSGANPYNSSATGGSYSSKTEEYSILNKGYTNNNLTNDALQNRSPGFSEQGRIDMMQFQPQVNREDKVDNSWQDEQRRREEQSREHPHKKNSF